MALVQFRTEAYNPFWPRVPTTQGLKPLLAPAIVTTEAYMSKREWHFWNFGHPFWLRAFL